MRVVCKGSQRSWRVPTVVLIFSYLFFFSKIFQLSREVLDIAASHVKPGVTTDEIDAIVHEETIKRGAYPSPLNYRKFPKSVCT